MAQPDTRTNAGRGFAVLRSRVPGVVHLGRWAERIMVYAILSLVLAPLCIALLILYLQQLSRVSELRADVAALQKAAAEAKGASRDFAHLLVKTRDYYDERVDRTEEEKRRMTELVSRWETFGVKLEGVHSGMAELGRCIVMFKSIGMAVEKTAQPVDTSAIPFMLAREWKV